MPFTPNDVSKVRRYLGYQATRDIHAYITGRLSDVQLISENEVAIAQGCVRELDAIMSSMGSAKNPNELRSQGQRLVNELSNQLGIAVREDIFAVSNSRIVRG